MGWTIYLLVITSLSFLAFKFISTRKSNRAFIAFAEQNGCKEPLDVTGPGYPSAWARLRRLMALKKTGEDLFDDLVIPDFKDAATVKVSVFDGTTILNTIEPANLQAMLATQFKDFETGSRRRNAFKPLLGRSIFTSDGAFWEHSRALFRPQFARENINDLEATDRAAKDLIDVIGEPDSSGWTKSVDLLPLLYNFTLDTGIDFLFGEWLGSQKASAIDSNDSRRLEKDSGLAKQQEAAKKLSGSIGIINDYLLKRVRFQSFWWMGDSLLFRKSIATVKNFADYYVQLACDPVALSSRKEGKKNSLINNLATQTLDHDELRHQLLAVLFASRDTTSALLGWCFVRLALHADVFNKLRSSILRDLPVGEPITFEKLKSCRYLQHFLNETLRLHPTAPFNQRSAVKDTTLPFGGGKDQRSPIAVRKGQMVLFSVYVMHRRKDLWGEDALEFKPERWEQKITPWYFLPFLGGPRICIGQQYALTEAGFLLCRVLQEFDAIEPANRQQMAKMKKGIGLTMWPGDGTIVRLRKASV